MQVLFNSYFTSQQKINNSKADKFNIFAPALFTPAFKMNMNELKGVDQFVARKYTINPQKFKTLEAFQKYCKELAEKLKNCDFMGRQKETQTQRKVMIEDWYKYIAKENGEYTGAMIFMIMSGITAGLKPHEDTLPPVLNRGVLADTVDKIKNKVQENPKDQSINFAKEYRQNLQKVLMEEGSALDSSLNGWILIPSKKHDPENFEANVDKLKMLSHDNWCTKSYNAEPYLAEGDFHVYMENGKPKLGVRFVGDRIQEIQGEQNNSKIPVKYGDIALEHIKGSKLRDKAKQEVRILEKVKAKIDDLLKKEFPNGIENYSVQEIFTKLGLECTKDNDGMLILSEFKNLSDEFTYSDLGLNERKLYGKIKAISGNANFGSVDTSSFTNLETIGGNVKIGSESQGYMFPKLREIDGNLNITDDYTYSLFELQRVGGNLHIGSTILPFEPFKNLTEVGGDLEIPHLNIKSLGSIKKIGGNADLNHELEDLGDLKEVGGNLDLYMNRQLKTFGNLETIGGDLYMEESEVKNIGNLKYVGGDVEPNDYLTIEDFKDNDVVVEGSFDKYPYDTEDIFDVDDVDESDEFENEDDYSDIFPDELKLFDEDPLYDDWG